MVLPFGRLSVLVALLSAPPDETSIPVVPAGPELTPWVRATLDVHARTTWTARTYESTYGSRVIVLREYWRGIPIVDATLALRVTPRGQLRQVVGTSLDPGTRLPAVVPRGAQDDGSLRWSIRPEGLVLARVEATPLTLDTLGPRRELRLIALEDRRVLASASVLDHASLGISGWWENPISTPEPQIFDVPVVDADPITLEDEHVRVLQCIRKGNACASEVFPIPLGPDDFLEPPPAIDDVAAHADPHDPWVGPQVFQYASRIVERYIAWGWDPNVWDVVGCGWQEVPPAECRLHFWVNVLTDGANGLEPYNGAFHTFGIGVFLGQGEHGDTGFDMQLVAHEIMHHVQRGFGDPEPTDYIYDGAFWRQDVGAINEGTSDLFARFASESDELYQYFRNHLGLYQGPYRRDVSIPFRCPENIVGEHHMDGRIWAAAWHDVHLALQDAGLADPDGLPSVFMAALPAIRQLPAENPVQFPTATDIVLDEIEVALGPTARELAESIVDERGLRDCSYVIDIREEPSLGGEPDPDDPFHSRVQMFRGRSADEDPTLWEEQPYAPPVQHRITLTDGEQGLVLCFVPDVWHRTDLADAPFDGEDLVFGALIKTGTDYVEFVHDPETNMVSNDAELELISQPDEEAGPNWRRIEIDGLEPGGTYTIALVVLSPVPAYHRAVMQSMQWSISPTDDAPSETGESGISETSGESDEGGGATPEGPAGCGCHSRGDPSRPLSLALWAALGALLRHRRRVRAQVSGR